MSTWCSAKAKLSTSVGYENLDRYVETTNGKDTLHDTVGILIQNEYLNENSSNDNLDQDYKRPNKRRRTFESVAPELVNYTKDLSLKEKLLSLNDPLRQIQVNDFEFITLLIYSG